MILLGFTGLGLETVFTAALDFPRTKDRHLLGYSSIWYWPLYALAPAYFQVFQGVLFPLPLMVRGLVYMVSFFAVEYVSMGALRLLLGSSPSEESYYKSRWNVHGLIRLDFAPAWFVAGLLFETFFRFLRHL